ncbi:hypothetical protein PFISCL1PPCAC_3511, partial [Pristionchus fissidentatus]
RVRSQSNSLTGYPIAFAKIVYQDYEFLEEQLAISYSDEHVFCFAVDRNVSDIFLALEMKVACRLSNISMNNFLRNVLKSGHFHNHAHFDCMHLVLLGRWNYIILMQNHDIVVKTTAEISMILKKLNGANDLVIGKSFWHDRCFIRESNFGKLGLCPGNLDEKEAENCARANIQLAKGFIHMTLSRETVEYITNQINITSFMNMLNEKV